MIWNGFPVFLAGTTDRGRHFHAFGLAICTTEDNEDFAFVSRVINERVEAIFLIIYKPIALVADATGAITIAFTRVFGEDFIRIMCYCHMERACARKLNGNDHKEAIILDLQSIQIAFSKPLFNFIVEKFKTKWFKYEEFLNYFDNEWVQQNSLWFEGATFNLSMPSHNNGLEAENLVMKRDHTLRSRLPLDQYLSNATHMLKNWSIDRTKHYQYVNIGNLKKRGRPSNANRGTPLKTQTNVI
jgi:hypothetical protein